MPIGNFEPKGMGINIQMFNLWLLDNGKHDYSVAGLFIVLLITCPISIKSVFSYNNRLFQSKLCLINIMLFALWHVLYVISFLYAGPNEGYAFHGSLGASFPAVSLILCAMARKAILDDEKLVRAADRIR